MTVAANLVAHAVQRQRLIFEFLKRLQDAGEFKLLALRVRPEVIGDDTVRAEDEHKSLLAGRPGIRRPSQARQPQSQVDPGGTQASLTQKFTS